MGSTLRHLQKTKGTSKMPAGGCAAPAAAPAGAGRGNWEGQPNSACRLSAEERRWLLVEQVASSRAQKHGLVPGEEWRDWFEAEAEVKLLLG